MAWVDPLALSSASASLLGAAIRAVLAATVAIYLNAVGRKRENRVRRRDLYSEAYRVALEWCEGVYRVRRRPPDGSGDQTLVEHFHAMQERIALIAMRSGNGEDRFRDQNSGPSFRAAHVRT